MASKKGFQATKTTKFKKQTKTVTLIEPIIFEHASN